MILLLFPSPLVFTLSSSDNLAYIAAIGRPATVYTPPHILLLSSCCVIYFIKTCMYLVRISSSVVLLKTDLQIQSWFLPSITGLLPLYFFLHSMKKYFPIVRKKYRDTLRWTPLSLPGSSRAKSAIDLRQYSSSCKRSGSLRSHQIPEGAWSRTLSAFRWEPASGSGQPEQQKLLRLQPGFR